LIQLGAGEEILPCAKEMNPIFCVLQGKGIITVDDQSNPVKLRSPVVAPSATISVKSDEGMRFLGIQIATRSS
jgi:hypothetical protein